MLFPVNLPLFAPQAAALRCWEAFYQREAMLKRRHRVFVIKRLKSVKNNVIALWSSWLREKKQRKALERRSGEDHLVSVWLFQ